MAILCVDLCIIGTGPASLALAAAASRLGARVALVDEGGPALPPPGALTAAALRTADFGRARALVRQAMAALAPNESPARYRGLGVLLLGGPARFVAPDRLQAGADEVRARRFVLSKTARPRAERPDHLTLDRLLDLAELPARLAVLGGSAFACEVAQAFARLGSRVTLVAPEGLLPREDPELAGFAARALAADGVALADAAEPGVPVLAAGEAGPDFGGLDLARAGVALEAGRPLVDRRLRTGNRRIFVASEAADAAVILKNALFRWPARTAELPAPRIAFTLPEIAQVGLTEAEAAARGPLEVLRWPLHDTARAQLQGTTAGLVKVLVGRRGRVLGAGIAGERAGELLLPWILAVEGGVGLARLAGAAVPPTLLSEASKRAAASFFLPRLLNARSRRLVRLLR